MEEDPNGSRLADVSSLGRDHRRRPTSAQGSLWGESEHGLPSKKGRWVAASRVRCWALASEDMARGGGCQSARVFGIGSILEASSIGGFWPSMDTVTQKAPNCGHQKVVKEGFEP